MIDPKNITDYNRTEAQLQEFLLFCIVVAGKNAAQQAVRLDKFIAGVKPFERVRALARYGSLEWALRLVKLGQYTRIARAFTHAAQLNPATCSLDQLEAISGIGPKTSRFFLLHSRPNMRYAVLDTHILKYMRKEHGIYTPKSTPTGKHYAELERRFLAICGNRNVADFDLEIWRKYSEIPM